MWFKRKRSAPAPVCVEEISGRSRLVLYSDGKRRCLCGYCCLATYEACVFPTARKWPTWPNGTPEGGCDQ